MLKVTQIYYLKFSLGKSLDMAALDPLLRVSQTCDQDAVIMLFSFGVQGSLPSLLRLLKEFSSHGCSTELPIFVLAFDQWPEATCCSLTCGSHSLFLASMCVFCEAKRVYLWYFLSLLRAHPVRSSSLRIISSLRLVNWLVT